MRLLNANAQKLELAEFFGDQIPPYAILSHTWGDDEVTFQDLQRGQYEHKLGFEKIRYTCQQAKRDELSWCWVDTCCIDKSSSAELSEAINSMFNWYARAQVCYAYLADVHCNLCPASGSETESFTELDCVSGIVKNDPTATTTKFPESCQLRSRMPCANENLAFSKSRWFQRGWTLQELIAPRHLEFFNHTWQPLGERDTELLHLVIERTAISPEVFGNCRALREIPIARRMSWMAYRRTTRKEDEAYCLLGIFGVNIPLLYGEAESAFARLQEELIRRFRDHSLLIFSDSTRNSSDLREPLAASPEDFAGCNKIQPCNTYKIPFAPESYHLTNDAIHIRLPLIRMERGGWRRDLALLGYTNSDVPIGLVLMRVQTFDGENTWIVCRREDYDTLIPDLVAMPSLGSGIVKMSVELAVTARQEALLIARDVRYAHLPGDPESDDAWLRYDLQLGYECGTPGFVPAYTVARHRKNRTPHMIRVKRLLSFPSTIFVLRFSLADLLKNRWMIITEDSPTPSDRPIDSLVVALTHQMPHGNIRGALSVSESPPAETEQQLLVTGEELLSRESFAESYWDNLVGDKCLDTVCVEGMEVLELWREGCIGDRKLSHKRLTLRVTHNVMGSRLLSDGTEEKREMHPVLCSSLNGL
jgi:hypothetical protein